MTGLNIIRSGAIESEPGFSPSGEPMRLAVDNPYMTKDEFINSYEAKGLGLSVNDPEYSNGELDRKLLQASSWINRHTRRWFDSQTIDETRTGFQVRPYNPQLVTQVFQNRPINAIESIYIQVLNWFIQVEVAQSGYLQIFPDKGFMKIVPLLSSAGTGLGTPIPAAILDRVPLGVLWTRYTFGYGTTMVALPLTVIGETKQYQATLGKRLWAPDQAFTVKDGSTTVDPTNYTVDYPNGIVTFVDSYSVSGAITVDCISNESIPFDIKEATILLACHLIGQALQNPVGAQAMGIQTFNINFGEKSNVKKRVEELLEPYVDRRPAIIGF